MEDQLVSFELAELANSKGFRLTKNSNPEYYGDDINYDLFTEYWYNDKKELESIAYPGDEGLSDYVSKENCHSLILAPTQSLLQKWIRENYKIQILIQHHYLVHDEIKYSYQINDIKNRTAYNTYEEALEAALFEALNLITL